MPRFFFDLEDTGSTDDLGGDGSVDLRDAKQARDEALRALGEIVRDELPDGDHREFTITVRDEARKLVLSAKLSLEVRHA